MHFGRISRFVRAAVKTRRIVTFRSRHRARASCEPFPDMQCSFLAAGTCTAASGCAAGFICISGTCTQRELHFFCSLKNLELDETLDLLDIRNNQIPSQAMLRCSIVFSSVCSFCTTSWCCHCSDHVFVIQQSMPGPVDPMLRGELCSAYVIFCLVASVRFKDEVAKNEKSAGRCCCIDSRTIT